MKKAIIWRESVYKSGKCPACGTSLLKGTVPDRGIIVDRDFLFCPGCSLCVGRLEDYDGPLEPGQRGGRWEEDE